MAGNRANPEALPLRELAASATVEQFDTSARVPREGSFRRFANAHPVATDLLVGGLYLIPILALVALAAPSFRISEPDPVQGILSPPFVPPSPMVPVLAIASVLLGTAMLVLWRRRHPLWLLVGTVVLQVTCRGLVGVEDNLLLFFALFAVAQRASAKTAWLGFAGAAAVITTVGFLYDTSLDGFVTLTPILVTWALAVAIFVHFGNRRRYVQALVELAKHLARERDQAAQIAAAEERARIARELHDVVAHSLAVMVTLSDGAVAVAETDPTAAKSTMVKVSETGRDAVSDMRRLLAVLRSSADRSPQPGAADLMPLVDSFRQTGLPVELELKASFPAHQALALAIYRIVQESLTNVLRYARSTPKVEVQVTAPRPGVYQVVVENAAPTALVLGSSPDREPADGQASDGVREGGQTAAEAAAGAELSRTWDGAGRGILGMTERAALFGGQLTAGPTKSGGWRVEATLEADH